LVEEAVQDALARALTLWPYTAVPDNPKAWLYQVARNRALDLLRREGLMRAKLDALALEPPPAELPPAGTGEAFGDDELAMMFMCCHPDLPETARIALTLKTVCGFSVEEIAAALLIEPGAVGQRLVRAKRQIRDAQIPIEMPATSELTARLGSVMDVLYLMFTEGHAAHAGENLVRTDLCAEAIRLARLLAQNPVTAWPTVHAALALFLLQAARLPARADAAGDLLLFDEQDRGRWDRNLMNEGMRHFGEASAGPSLTPYHIEAAIAACHAAAAGSGQVDWPAVLKLYDDLLALKPSPVIALNRAIALAMVQGPHAGIAAIEAIRDAPAFGRYHLLPAALGALWLRAGTPVKAAQFYRAALELPSSAPERRFLIRRLAQCERIVGSDP
jgi:RNA polymerase sigma-70 factor (ECF subfamily)